MDVNSRAYQRIRRKRRSALPIGAKSEVLMKV